MPQENLPPELLLQGFLAYAMIWLKMGQGAEKCSRSVEEFHLPVEGLFFFLSDQPTWLTHDRPRGQGDLL